MEYFHTTTATNVTLSIVLAAEQGLTHFLTAVSASYSLAPVGGRLSVLDGTTPMFDVDIVVQNLPTIVLADNPLHATQGNAMEIKLAPGGLANTAKLNVFGYSRM